MLPARPRHPFRLADVMTDALAALDGVSGPLALPPLRHAIVVVVDGLGAAALADRAGHARTLAPRLDRTATAGTVFPSTTAAALATLTTGAEPGEHGMVGYTALDPDGHRIVNLLSGWDDRLVPERWQPIPTVFERAVAAGIAAAAVGPSRYAGSGLSRAILRGADYLPASAVDERMRRAREHAASVERSLCYVYVPEVDTAGHRFGVDSEEWTRALEVTDAAIAELVSALPRGAGVLVTADHGALDVPASSHVLVDPQLLSAVRLIAGEPRCLQLHLHPGADAESVAADLDRAYGSVGWALTRDRAVADGLFGPVREEVAPRIGDVLLGARRRVAFYTDEDDTARRMIGQHGSLSPEEIGVPLLRFGAAER